MASALGQVETKQASMQAQKAAEDIRAGVVTMCQQLVAVQALLRQDPHHAAARELHGRIRAGIAKNQRVLRRKYGVVLDVLRQGSPEGNSPEPPPGSPGASDDDDGGYSSDNDAAEADFASSSSSSSDSSLIGVPRRRQRREGPPGSAVQWQKGELVAARGEWSAQILDAEGFAGWAAGTSGAAQRIMAAMGFKEGQGLGRRGDGIAFPLAAYAAPGTSRPLGLGHPHRAPKAESHTAANRPKRRRQKASRREGSISPAERAAGAGSRAFPLVNRLAKARDGDEDRKEAVHRHLHDKEAERKAYRTLAPNQLRQTLAHKLRAKDQVTAEIQRLTSRMRDGETGAHAAVALIDRKRGVLETLAGDVSALMQLVGEREKQKKALRF